jgi:hypothetical protein
MPHALAASRGEAAKSSLDWESGFFYSMWACPPETWPCGTSDIQSAVHSQFDVCSPYYESVSVALIVFAPDY